MNITKYSISSIKIPTIGILVVSALILALATTLFSRQVQAQGTEVNLTVSPPISYLHVPPGSARSHTITLENSGTTPLTVLPTIVDFTTDGKTGRAIVTNQLTFPYISMGVDNSVSQVTIPPQKKAQLTLYITIPKDAQEKEYPVTILFFSQSESEKDQDENNLNSQNDQDNQKNQNDIENKTNSQVNAAIGSNLVVLVSKQNTFSKLLKVASTQVAKLHDSFQKVEFTPVVQNNSFGAITASGSAKIVDWNKQTVVEFKIYPDTILGHNSRELRALLSDADPTQPEVGSFTFKPKFLLGPYQVITTLTDENGVVLDSSVSVFYAFPIVVIIAVAVGFGISVYFSKNKTKNNDSV